MKSEIIYTTYRLQKSEFLKIFQIPGVSFNENLKETIVGKDIICTDSIPSNMIDDFKEYQISKELMSLANENSVLNPCPPFYGGEEITEDAIDSDFFVGYEFKKDLLKVQQAILIYCLST